MDLYLRHHVTMSPWIYTCVTMSPSIYTCVTMSPSIYTCVAPNVGRRRHAHRRAASHARAERLPSRRGSSQDPAHPSAMPTQGRDRTCMDGGRWLDAAATDLCNGLGRGVDRGVPADADKFARDCIESEGGIGKVPVRRVFGCLGIDMGPRRSPSSWPEIFKKNGWTWLPSICAWLS